MDDADRHESGEGVRRDDEAVSGGAFETAPFDLVTEETRASILGTLATHQAEHPREPAMAFTDLREAAGVDDSGNSTTTSTGSSRSTSDRRRRDTR